MINKLFKSLSIAAMLHISVLDLAIAQTTSEMRSAASQANTDTFKYDPSDLYSRSGQRITINDGAPSGDITFNSRRLNYDVSGQSASDGALPNITTYEDLYSYRDTELGELESGSGQFQSTGSLNAEANAMSVLRDSEGMPAVGTDFLFRSTEILDDGSEQVAEFGECIIVQQTDTVEYNYDNSVINTCDTSGLDLSPMSAGRVYNGPKPLFNYRRISGQGYCQRSGVRVKTDSEETCAKLSILSEIPTNDRGDLSVRGCSGNDQCVELVFDQDGSASGAIMRFSARPGITLRNARVTASGLHTNGYVSHNGSNILTGDGRLNVAAITSNPTITHEIGISGGTDVVEVRVPPTGYANTTENYYLYDDSFYYSDREELRLNGALTNFEGFPHPDGACSVRRGPEFMSDPYSSGENHDGVRHYYQIYRTCLDTTNVDARVVLRLNFSSTDLFSDWGYNANRYQELLSLASDAACTIEYTVESSVADSNGCVNSWVGSSGTPGKLCGSDIPVSPFGMISDRGATQITITPSCLEDPRGNVFTETNNCSLLENDSSCTFIGRTCSLTLDGGECAAYENRYQCGEVESYSAPVVEELNICESNLSCLGDDCILNTGTSGANDLADTAAKLAAADMLMSDMQCSQNLETAIDRDEAMLSCELFTGKRETCSRRTLGLSNCCTTPTGVSVADYMQLAFSVSRVSRALEGTSLSNPLTSSWVSMEDMARNSFSELTRPLTETWESIIGNTDAAQSVGNALSLEAVKQEMMKKTAEWTVEIFGEQAANSIFQGWRRGSRLQRCVAIRNHRPD